MYALADPEITPGGYQVDIPEQLAGDYRLFASEVFRRVQGGTGDAPAAAVAAAVRVETYLDQCLSGQGDDIVGDVKPDGAMLLAPEDLEGDFVETDAGALHLDACLDPSAGEGAWERATYEVFEGAADQQLEVAVLRVPDASERYSAFRTGIESCAARDGGGNEVADVGAAGNENAAVVEPVGQQAVSVEISYPDGARPHGDVAVVGVAQANDVIVFVAAGWETWNMNAYLRLALAKATT